MKYFRLIIYLILICQYTYAQATIINNDVNITNKLLLQSSYYIDENNLTMAKTLASKVMKILYENNNVYDTRMINAYNLMAYIELEKENIKQAKRFMQKALSIQDVIKKPHHTLISTYYIVALIEELEKNYTVATDYYHQTLQLIKELNSSKLYKTIQEKSIRSIKLLSDLAKNEIVYKEHSFLDFVNQVKDNYPNISIQEFISNKSEHNKSIECMLKLCKKIIPKYLEVDAIYSKYLKNPSQTKENLFDLVKITNFNYLLDTVGVCSLNYSDKNTTLQKLIIDNLHKDISMLLKNSKNPMELDIIALSYKKFYKIISGLNDSLEFVKNNKYLTKTDFFNKLQVYKDIQLKEQDPKLILTIPENKKKLLFKRYEYFKNYFKEYFLTMKNIIHDNDYNEWDNYLNKLTLIIKNKNNIIANNGEHGRAKVWAAGVMLYFKSTLHNYNILLKTHTTLNKTNKVHK